MIVGLFGIAGLSGCFKAIDSGARRSSLDHERGNTARSVWRRALHLIAPWNKLTTYDVRPQDRKEMLHILTNNGLSVSLEASIRYRPVRDELARLHGELGPEYFEVILAPVVRSEARKVGGRYAP